MLMILIKSIKKWLNYWLNYLYISEIIIELSEKLSIDSVVHKEEVSQWKYNFIFKFIKPFLK